MYSVRIPDFVFGVASMKLCFWNCLRERNQDDLQRFRTRFGNIINRMIQFIWARPRGSSFLTSSVINACILRVSMYLFQGSSSAQLNRK
jgi:hypothetical protein